MSAPNRSRPPFRVVLVAALAVGAACFGAPESLGARAAAARADACSVHAIERCPFCDPSLLESMGFCRGHGVPEAVCTKCRGDLEEAFRAMNDWCSGHGVPESHCEACNPGTLERFRVYDPTAGVPRDEPEPAAQVEIVREDVPRSHRAPSVTCATERSVVRFADAGVAARAGLEVSEVRSAPLRRTVSAPAELRYDATRHARLAPRAAGVVVEVRARLGDAVDAGDVLAVIDSAALGSAKSALLQAAARVELWSRNHERERRLADKGLSTEKAVIEAEIRLVEDRIALAEARHRLRNLGLDDGRVAEFEAARDVSGLLHLTAPFAGVVVAQDAVVGQLADPTTPLLAVADTSRLWAVADVAPGAIGAVEVGQPVLLALDGIDGETFGGRVAWLSTEVDPRTRTVEVRAELENPAGRLRARSFGRMDVVTRDGEEALLVPKDAVQWEGCCNVAFVRRSATEFAPRKLLLGHDAGDHVEVLAGLAAGERVVTRGSFLLKTELMKGSIGAGCCEVDQLAR